MKYIGRHKCKCEIEDDKDYLGSGTFQKQAIERYGPKNFEKKILCECKTRDEACEKEKEYIKKYDAVRSHMFYNVAPGGESRPEGYKKTKDEIDKIRYLEYKMNNNFYFSVEPVDIKLKNGDTIRKISIMRLRNVKGQWYKTILNTVKSTLPNNVLGLFEEYEVLEERTKVKDDDPIRYAIDRHFIPIEAMECPYYTPIFLCTMDDFNDTLEYLKKRRNIMLLMLQYKKEKHN